MSYLNFIILAFLTNFYSIRLSCLVTLFDRKLRSKCLIRLFLLFSNTVFVYQKVLLFSLCNLRVHNYLKLMNSGSFRSFTNIKSGFSGISRFDGFNDMIHNFFLDQSDCTSTKTTTSHSRSINSIAF